MGFGWLYGDEAGRNRVVVMTVLVIMTQGLNPVIVVAMVGPTVQLWLVGLVAVLVKSELMAMVARLNGMLPLRRSRRNLYHSWIMMPLKLVVGKRMHKSFLFHFSHSVAFPYLLLRESSWVCRAHPLVRVPLVTSDKIETLTAGLVSGSRASFLDFDAADELGPAHPMRQNLVQVRVT